MARSLTFSFRKKNFDARLIKVDRDQLYGTVRLRTVDKDEKRCSLATLASNGKTLIPRGGSALGYVNTLGEWIPRNQLNPVSPDGQPLDAVASSFDNPIALDDALHADSTEFLNHSVRLCYRLEAESEFPKTLLKLLKKGTLLCFGFSYRGGIAHDPAFIMTDESDTLWMLVTTANDVEYVSLEQAALCGGEIMTDAIDNDDEDNLDFNML